MTNITRVQHLERFSLPGFSPVSPDFLFLSRTNCVSFTALTLFSGDRTATGSYFLVKKYFPLRLFCPPPPIPSSCPLLGETYFKTSPRKATLTRILARMKYATLYYIPLVTRAKHGDALIARRWTAFVSNIFIIPVSRTNAAGVQCLGSVCTLLAVFRLNVLPRIIPIVQG